MALIGSYKVQRTSLAFNSGIIIIVTKSPVFFLFLFFVAVNIKEQSFFILQDLKLLTLQSFHES